MLQHQPLTHFVSSTLSPSHAFQTLLTHHLIFNTLYLYPFTSPKILILFFKQFNQPQNIKIKYKDQAPKILPQNTL